MHDCFRCEGIVIEVILLESDEEGGYLTNFFNHRYQFIWPPDPLRVLVVSDHKVSVPQTLAQTMNLFLLAGVLSSEKLLLKELVTWHPMQSL